MRPHLVTGIYVRPEGWYVMKTPSPSKPFRDPLVDQPAVDISQALTHRRERGTLYIFNTREFEGPAKQILVTRQTPKIVFEDHQWIVRDVEGVEVVEVHGVSLPHFRARKMVLFESFARSLGTVEHLMPLSPHALTTETAQQYASAVSELRHFKSPAVIEGLFELMEYMGGSIGVIDEFKGSSEAAHQMYLDIHGAVGQTLSALLKPDPNRKQKNNPLLVELMSRPCLKALTLKTLIDVAVNVKAGWTIPEMIKIFDGLWETCRIPTFCGTMHNGREYWDLRFVDNDILAGWATNFEGWLEPDTQYALGWIHDRKGIHNIQKVVAHLNEDESLLYDALLHAHDKWRFLDRDRLSRIFLDYNPLELGPTEY